MERTKTLIADSTVAGARRRRRRRDPDRRHRIARAAVEVLHRDGVLALSHRAVAEEADVPLGSTTYHFQGLDDLLAAALEWISDEEIRILDEWQAAWDLDENLMAALVDLLLIYCNQRRAMSILEYEVHVLAYRRPVMRELSRRWDRALNEILSRYMSSADADLVIAMMDGVMLNNLTVDSPLLKDWARFCLAKVVPA
jgi:TetR/AcrR family transcriptional regulator, regulator of biofilm formation and stress response